jgi:hypothetical protein
VSIYTCLYLSLISVSISLHLKLTTLRHILIICRHHIETPLAYGNAKFGLALSS